MNERARSLLWPDGGAGAVVGLLVVTLREWLASLYSFPKGLVLFIGLANLAYSSYSTTLAVLASTGRTPKTRSLRLLVVANGSWVFVCAVILASTWRSASVLGLASVALEGIFVGSLAYAEYRVLLKR